MPNARRALRVSYPVTMVRSVTLRHHLTQVHFQRFFQRASVRMASVQGLRLNENTDEEIERLEALFNATLEKAVENLTGQVEMWRERIKADGVDPAFGETHDGEAFDAPLTTPWGNKLLRIYSACDEALMLVEMCWIIEEFGVLEKREDINHALLVLTGCTRAIERAVTQAFQESRKRQVRIDAPPAYGDAGKHLLEKAPDALAAIKALTAREADVFNAGVEKIKAEYTDPEVVRDIEELRIIRLALAERRERLKAERRARAGKNSDAEGTEPGTEDAGGPAASNVGVAADTGDGGPTPEHALETDTADTQTAADELEDAQEPIGERLSLDEPVVADNAATAERAATSLDVEDAPLADQTSTQPDKKDEAAIGTDF